MAGRKKALIQQAAEDILKKKNVDYNEWKREVINKKKLEVMSDEDKEWTEQTIDRAALEIIMNEVTEKSKIKDLKKEGELNYESIEKHFN